MKAASAPTAQEKLPAAAAKAVAASVLSTEPATVESVPEIIQPVSLPVETDRSKQTNVDDLLAAVEELRTRRPGVRARKKPPSPEELKRRRQDLRENLGRVLASL
jgi:hypothetical protein